MRFRLTPLIASFVWLLALFPSHAEDIPAPPEPAAHYYLEIPPGGLHDFMRWHPLRIPLVSHHRGGPVPGYPENAIETMQHALRYGPGLMEIDVAQLKDGTLVLMHDDTLDRTSTGKGDIAAKTWDEIKDLRLRDNDGNLTDFRIPRLADVLKWTVGRAILTLDIKRGTDFAAVAKAVEDAGASDYVAVITYSLGQAEAFQTIAPEMMQTVTIRNKEELDAVLASNLKSENIIAWTGIRPAPPSHYRALHERGWRVIAGTLGKPDTSIDGQIARSGENSGYLDIIASGADILATDRFWAVQAQFRNPNIFVFVRSQLYR